MAQSIYPIPNTTVVAAAAKAFTVPTAKTSYKCVVALDSGVYKVETTPNTSEAMVDFITASTATRLTTSSGVTVGSIADPIVELYIETLSGTNIVVTITKTSEALVGTTLSGTLDTLTTSGTYNQTGKLYVVTVGGGGGGCGTHGGAGNQAGGGGASGGINYGIVYRNSATTYTIGTGGNNTRDTEGNSGGTTTFSNVSANGGAGGRSNYDWAEAGTPYGGRGARGSESGQGGEASTAVAQYVKTGTTGGGGAGYSPYAGGPGAGAGSGIGTGGNGGTNNVASGAGNSGTGYGSGGGGSAAGSYIKTGDGAPGVIYVLRGF